MARVTVEDCIDKVTNRFDLVLFAAHRARAISGGESPTIERDRDKNPVVALREIAEQTVDPHNIEASLTTSMQKLVPDDDVADDMDAIIGSSADFMASALAGSGAENDKSAQPYSSDVIAPSPIVGGVIQPSFE